MRTRRWVALATCAAIAAIVFGAPDPNSDFRSTLALHDLGHVVAFGLVTALFVSASPARLCPTFQNRVGTAWLAAGAALALGATVELVQAASGRNGDPWDVVRDGGGALVAALILTARDPAISARARVILLTVAILVLAPFMYPLWAALDDEARARGQFPVLASFETVEELSRFHFREESKVRLVTALDDKGRGISAMQLHLPPGKYPGFVLAYFPRDWRAMRALRLMMINPEAVPVDITVRIDDADYDYKLDLADRYNRSFPLLPGTNRVEIPLSDVAAAPRGRRFDLGRVQSLLVYAVDLERSREIIIGPIVLLP